MLIGSRLGGTRLATTFETFQTLLLGRVIEAEQMVVERTLPAEAPRAVRVCAAVRLLVGVDAEVTLEVVFAVELLGASGMRAAMRRTHVEGGGRGRCGRGRVERH